MPPLKDSAAAAETCTHGEIIQVTTDISCRSFFLCAYGHQMLMTCAPGTMFDTKTLSCNHMTMVSCSTLAASTMKSKKLIIISLYVLHRYLLIPNQRHARKTLESTKIQWTLLVRHLFSAAGVSHMFVIVILDYFSIPKAKFVTYPPTLSAMFAHPN